MQRYRSHKVVEAVRIVSSEFAADGSGKVVVEGGAGAIFVPPGFASRGTPHQGDYLVVYGPDNYLSWSPKAVFEAGYTAEPA